MPWIGVGIAALSVIVLGVAWQTERGEAGDFPEALLNAVGLLLTALVFVLALAQSRLHRMSDSVAEEVRRLDEVLLDAYAGNPEAVTTLDLWERTSVMKEALFSDSGDWKRWERRLVLRAARRPVTNWGVAGRLDRAADIYRIDRELEREPTDRRRNYLIRERKRIIRDDDEDMQATRRAGITTHGYHRLRARAAVAELSVNALVSSAQMFILLMLGLILLGAIYAGWSLDRMPSPEAWAAVVLIALALVYTRVVRNDINLEMASLASALRDSPLFGLATAETAIHQYWVVVEADDPRADGSPLSRKRVVADLLDQVMERSPDLPWLASARGRLLLIQAIDSARRIYKQDWSQTHDERMQEELVEALRPSTRLLRFAARRNDDPVAALALARLLVLQAEIARDGLLDPIPDFFDGDPDQCQAQSGAHVERALSLMRNLPTLPSGIFSIPHRTWIAGQSYLWPRDAALRELKGLLLINTEPPSHLDAPNPNIPDAENRADRSQPPPNRQG